MGNLKLAGLCLAQACVVLLVAALPARSQDVWDVARGLSLRGDLVTMNDALEVIPNGCLVIMGEKIAAVLAPGAATASGLPIQWNSHRDQRLRRSDRAHNHISYNVLLLTDVPEWHPARLYSSWKVLHEKHNPV